jgi:serine/threonine-protein kinase
MPLADGQVYAGYTIVRKLGEGGMGMVYLAQHPRLPRRDALKVLPAALTVDDEYRQRFNREADIAATLWHPHIVEVHDRGALEGRLWISMDYVDGIDANSMLKQRYPNGMPPDVVTNRSCCIATSSPQTSCCRILKNQMSESSWPTSGLDAGSMTAGGSQPRTWRSGRLRTPRLSS